MSDFVEWIAAEAQSLPPKWLPGKRFAEVKEKCGGERVVDMTHNLSVQSLPAHNFPGKHNIPARPNWREEWQEDDPLDRNPQIGQYRERTVALLRRYMRASLETGRLPSMVGKEFFRATVTAYRSVTFEDRVIFVSDVEKILSRLEYWDQQLIARLILQEHSQEKTARLLHCNCRTVQRRLPEVLDVLSERFLEVGLLVAVRSSGGKKPQ
jgi:hypothetical protein